MTYWHGEARSGGAERVWTFVGRQPSWVARLAAGAALLVMAAMALVLILPAIIAAGVVFLVLSGYVRLRRLFGGPRSGRRSLGRRNVRVIVRDDR